MSLDPKVISAATYLVKDEAQRRNRAWDQQGIHAAIRGALEDDGRDVLPVLCAAFEAVSDAKANTPAALRWPDRYKAAKGGQDWMNNYGPDCATCGRSMRHHEAAEEKLPVDKRHPFEEAP